LVAGLPEAFREVIVLREIEDLSYSEIADIINAPIGTVMSRLARARATLREAWLRAAPQEARPDGGEQTNPGQSQSQTPQPPSRPAQELREQFK
jgi:hypothetical protein